MKNCDRGLENAARGRMPRAAFSRPRERYCDPDRAKNQSDCRILYRARLEKNK